MDPLDFPAYFDIISRTHGMLATFYHADWRRAYRRAGWLGLVTELGRSVISANAPTIYVRRYTHWRGIDVEWLLARHGITIWDRGLSGDDLYFCVKLRQARWAEYVLLRAGVPVNVERTLIDPRNAGWVLRHPIGSEPAAHRARLIGRRRP